MRPKSNEAPDIVGVISGEPHIALPQIQVIAPKAFLHDFRDPLDALTCLASGKCSVLADSSLSICGVAIGEAGRPITFPDVETSDLHRASELCTKIGWELVNPD